MDHDTRHLDGKECPHLQLEADDLDITFYFPINQDTFPLASETNLYQQQQNLAFHLCNADEGEKIRKIIPIDISRSGVTLITRFSTMMEQNMDVLLDALSIISGIEVEHIEWGLIFTNEEYTWADVVPDDSGYYRLMTEGELIEYDKSSGYSEDYGGM